MNILFIEYPHAYFQRQCELVKSGHNVWTACSKDTEYDKSFGIESLEYNHWITWTEDNCQPLIDKIVELEIATVINGIPWVWWLRDKMPEGVTYLGGTEAACELETNKFATRNAVAELGLGVATLIGEGNTSPFNIEAHTERPLVIKPKNTFTNSTRIINEGEDAIAKEYFDGLEEHYDYYLEQFIPNLKLEAEVDFIIANGEWKITYTGQYKGETERRAFSNNKEITGAWITDITCSKLPQDIEDKVKEYAETFLNWAVTKGGNYKGGIVLGVDDSNDLYWIECNVRPDSFNIIPCLISGDDYLEALTTNPAKYVTNFANRDAWKFTTFVSTINNNPLQEYPFYLHAEYDVAVPNCLLKQGDIYRSYCGGVILFSEGDLPSEFVTKLTSIGQYEILTI